MADFKYIVFQDERTGRRLPVLFPNELVHAEVADALIACGLMNSASLFYRPVSAGFVMLAVSSSHGESESLKIKSDPEDAQRINVHTYTAGVDSGMEPMIEKMLLSKVIEQLMERITDDQ